MIEYLYKDQWLPTKQLAPLLGFNLDRTYYWANKNLPRRRTKPTITIDLMGKAISEQLLEQQCAFDEEGIEILQGCADSITLLKRNALLTHTEESRARKRLIKSIRALIG